MEPTSNPNENQQQQQQQPPSVKRENTFSPTNPFHGVGDDETQVRDGTSPVSGTSVPQNHHSGSTLAANSGGDMNSAANRLANLQLNNPSGSDPMTPPPAQGQGQGQGQVAASAAAAAAAGAPISPATNQPPQQPPMFAPGYGPSGMNVGPPPQQPYMQGPPPNAQQQPPPPQQQQHTAPLLPPIVGPMLQFVDVDLETAAWKGSVVVLTNESLLPNGVRPAQQQQQPQGEHPNTHAPVVELWDDPEHGPGAGKPKTFVCVPLYTEPTYKYTFWRANLSLALPQESEISISYQIYWDADETAVQSHSARTTYTFRLPAQSTQWRMCVTSNTQFSRRVPEQAKLQRNGSGPVFKDLMNRHKAQPFHLWMGTGGQFNGEGVWDDCERALRPFLNHNLDNPRRSRINWTQDMATMVERWYFLEYLRQWFGIGGRTSAVEEDGQTVFANALTSIPYSFAADTEIFPGYGSYGNALQYSPVFSGIKEIGSRYYALFQAHTTPTAAKPEHGYLGETGYHSIRKLGPYTALLMLDTRTVRKPTDIVGHDNYLALFKELEQRVPPTTSNLIVVASNPVIFPRTKNFENFLRGANTTGLTSLISYAVNNKQQNNTRNEWIAKDRFGDSVAATMLNDFWTAQAHRKERNYMIRILQDFSRKRSCRVTFVSGHVNCLSASHLQTYPDANLDPRKYQEKRGFMYDFRSMIQLTVSGIVQVPVDDLTLRAYHFAGKSASFDMFTEEKMYRTFTVDVNQHPPNNGNQKLLARRSYGIIVEKDFDGNRQHPGLLSYLYVENEACTGAAPPYMINIPALYYQQQQQQQQPQPQQQAPPPVRNSVSYRSSGGGGGGGGGEGVMAPPPYSPVNGELPNRTDGTYSSSYEHTMAWVQQEASNSHHSAEGRSSSHSPVAEKQ